MAVVDVDAVGHALALAGSTTWGILSALVLGVALSAVIQAAAPEGIVTLLADGRQVVRRRSRGSAAPLARRRRVNSGPLSPPVAGRGRIARAVAARASAGAGRPRYPVSRRRYRGGGG